MTAYLALICLLKITICLSQPFKDPAMSVASMRGLIYLENFFLNELSAYSQALQLKIDTIESFLAEVQAKQQKWEANLQKYVANPLHSFSLIRRLHEDWSYFELYMSGQVGHKQSQKMSTFLNEVAPKKLDLEDVLKAFVRMQSYYNLNETELTKGIIDGKQYSSQLTTLECYVLATFCNEHKLKESSLNWCKAAIEQYNYTRDNELYEQVYDLLMGDIYDLYVNLLSKRGHDKEALNVLNDITDLDVSFWLRRRMANDIAHFTNNAVKPYIHEASPVQKGCRSQNQKGAPATNLTCYLKKSDSSFLLLAPLKIELLSLSPHVALVHNAIYDKEIKQLTSQEPHTLKHERSEQHRNSLKYTILENNITKVLNARAMDMTGMTVEYDKSFLLMNYGVGGHITLHSDRDYIREQMGKQMASIIFFLSDVLQGGYTVFPFIHLAIKPTKGAALVWLNTNSINLKETRHASCPVLVGSKWTLVKWLWAK